MGLGGGRGRVEGGVDGRRPVKNGSHGGRRGERLLEIRPVVTESNIEAGEGREVGRRMGALIRTARLPNHARNEKKDDEMEALRFHCSDRLTGYSIELLN